MSAPPFFQSAGRGDLQFWGEDDGSMGKFIGIGAKAVVGKDRQVELEG